eukprot:2814841-Rhodomonas_salina.2
MEEVREAEPVLELKYKVLAAAHSTHASAAVYANRPIGNTVAHTGYLVCAPVLGLGRQHVEPLLPVCEHPSQLLRNKPRHQHRTLCTPNAQTAQLTCSIDDGIPDIPPLPPTAVRCLFAARSSALFAPPMPCSAGAGAGAPGGAENVDCPPLASRGSCKRAPAAARRGSIGGDTLRILGSAGGAA